MRLDRTAVCPRFLHGSDSHHLPSLESRTDHEGRFEITGLSTIVRCIVVRWIDRLIVLAPGYLPDFAEDNELYDPAEKSVRSGTFKLRPVRYRIEFDAYRDLQTNVDYQEKEIPTRASSVAFKDTLNAAKGASFRVLTQRGVFASQPGANFRQVEIVRTGVLPKPKYEDIVLVRSQGPNSFSAWNVKGGRVATLSGVPDGFRLVGRKSFRPVLVRENHIYLGKDSGAILADPESDHWLRIPAQYGRIKSILDIGMFLISVEHGGEKIAIYSLEKFIDWAVPRRKPGEPRRVEPGLRLDVPEILPGGHPPIECIAKPGGATSEIVFIAFSSGKRSLFTASADERSPNVLKARRIDAESPLFQREITACVGGGGALCVAEKGRGIFKVVIGQTRGFNWKYLARMKRHRVLQGQNGPLNFTSLAYGRFYRDHKALYAVASDENVYRFSTDLVPDQRIEIVGSKNN